MSEQRSRWGLRALALVLAVLAWFLATAERRERRTDSTTVEALISYTTPEQMILLRSVEQVRIGIRGTSSQIQVLNPFQVSVGVNLRDAEKGAREVNLTPRDVVAPEGLEVISIEPNQFVVELDQVVSEIRPIEPDLVGEPAAGAVVLGVEVVPGGGALISGPESLISDLRSLATSPVSLNGHALDFEERAAVISPNAKIQIVQPALVTIRVKLEVPSVGGNREGPEAQ